MIIIQKMVQIYLSNLNKPELGLTADQQQILGKILAYLAFTLNLWILASILACPLILWERR